MDINVAIVSVGANAADGQVVLSLSIATSTGLVLGTDLPIVFANSSTQMNNAIIDRVKAILPAFIGRQITASDKIKLFGGAV